MKFLLVRRKTVAAFLVFGLALVSVWISSYFYSNTVPAFGTKSAEEEVRVIHMVTGEFKARMEDGREIEVYRWDPSTIFLEKGEKATLNIYGVNGHEHPFVIEGTNIKGTVKKGEETIIPLQFEEEGVYRLICSTHPDKNNSGPMIAYIIVD
ncbi:Cupredoxin-like domain-containing protein [Evansella caseinilytica]|uniref:Cupredoxin-like domain-containing protein n=1 Tax=Evansella caseinilytica TaxID=1503961 RepID=A0A1H3GQZ6_9BACI|nr:cupredoxin domain-containing protein [Evansella caseinilytica]SDY05068.1 Cupredoxin-like domain-containing protein [Evansella caseinilytica]